MKRSSLAFLFVALSFAGFSQDPVKTQPVHAIPAEKIKQSSSSHETRALPRDDHSAILSAEVSKDKKQVTVTPLPANTSPPRQGNEEKNRKK